MRYLLGLGLLLYVVSCHAQTAGEHELFGITIGEKAPDQLVGNRVTEGPFLFVTVPSKTRRLQAALQDVNVFIFPDSHIVAGLRGDRVFNDMAACNEASQIITRELKAAFPSAYSGSDARYQFQSKDGRILAGVVCARSRPFPQLTVEITDPQLEEKLMKPLREKR